LKLKKSDNTVIEYNRDDSKLHNATSIIIISNLIAWLILCIDIIAILISEKYRVVMVVVAIIILAYGIFCDLYYNYQEMCSIKIVKDREKDNKNKIVYQYRLNDSIAASGNCLVVVMISDIREVKRKGKKIEIHGNATVKKPMSKTRNTNKVRINGDNYNIEIQDIVESIKNYCM